MTTDELARKVGVGPLFDPPARTATEFNIRLQALRAGKIRRRRAWERACNNYDRKARLIPRDQAALTLSFVGSCRRAGDLTMWGIVLRRNPELRAMRLWGRLP